MFGLAILLLARDATGSFATAGRVVGGVRARQRARRRRAGAADGPARPAARAARGGGRPRRRAGRARAGRRGRARPRSCSPARRAGGCSLPQLPAAMRSLWGMLVPDAEPRRTAYALVSIVFEVSVISAPVLAAVIVALASPAAAVLVARPRRAPAARSASASPHASRRWRGEPHAVGWLGPLEAPGMRVVLAVLTLFGTADRRHPGRRARVHGRARLAGGRRAPARGAVRPAAWSAGSSTARAPGRAACARQLVALMAGLAAAYCLLALAGVAGRPGGAAGRRRPAARAHHGGRLHAARPRRAAGHRDRGVHRHGHGHRGRAAAGNALGGAIVEGAAFEAAVRLGGRRGRRRRADRAQDSVMRIWRMTIGCSGCSSGPTSATPILSTTSWPFVTLPSSA